MCSQIFSLDLVHVLVYGHCRRIYMRMVRRSLSGDSGRGRIDSLLRDCHHDGCDIPLCHTLLLLHPCVLHGDAICLIG